MVAYHISKNTGEVNVCVARPGNCNMSFDNTHYDSKEEAYKAFETQMVESAMPSISRKDSKVVDSVKKNIEELFNGYENEYEILKKLKSNDVDEKFLDKALQHESYVVRSNAAGSPHINDSQIKTAFSDSNYHVKYRVITNQHVSDKKIEEWVKNDDVFVRNSVAVNPKLTTDQINTLLKDVSHDVRTSAVENPNINDENIDLALTDKHEDVRATAARYAKKEEQIDTALKDKSFQVRLSAVSNKKSTKNHLRKAIFDVNDEVRKAAFYYMSERYPM